MKKIKMGIIGAGVWGRTHAFLYKEDPRVELKAICDKDENKAKTIAKTFNISNVYLNHTEMLKNCDLDAVAVVTPDFAHRELVVDCALAGKHILVEKPLATTREDVQAIVEAVNKAKVRIMVDFHNRWNPPFTLTKESIKNGDIGEPSNAYYRLNDIKWVATDMLPWAEKSSILWFLGSHSVDSLRWLFEDEVEEVFSMSKSGILQALGVNTKDIYQTILRFKKGYIATMENGWITPNKNPCINDIKFSITGSRGMINLDLSHSQMIDRITEEKEDRPDILVNHFVHGKAKGFAYESIRHFVDRLVDGDDFYVSLEDAVNTTLTILSIMESADSGKMVKVDYKY